MNLPDLLNLIRPMRFYTVLYTCARGYNCFRTVKARSEHEASNWVLENVHNVGGVTGVLPYVGR